MKRKVDKERKLFEGNEIKGVDKERKLFRKSVQK